MGRVSKKKFKYHSCANLLRQLYLMLVGRFKALRNRVKTISLKENFPYWTSGNKEIDELIQYTQLNAIQTCDYLEWIPFEKFEMVKYIDKGGFSSIYSALWMEGPRWIWDDGAQEWTRAGPTNVVLKRLDNSQNISSSYINQVIML